MMMVSRSFNGSLLVSAAERIWWQRIRRAGDRQGLAGQKVLADWSHSTLAVLGAGEELVDGRWQSIPPERRTDEHEARETRRLNDELGRVLGVGPMPL